MSEKQQQEERIRELEEENARLKQLILKLRKQSGAGTQSMSTKLREALRE